MLDQRLLREDPELIRLQLARRGLSPNLTELQGHALRQRQLGPQVGAQAQEVLQRQ